MNHITNDKDQIVAAVGAPGSEARLEVEHPALIEDLEARWVDLQSETYRYTSGVDYIDAEETIKTEIGILKGFSESEKQGLFNIVVGESAR